MTVEYYSSSVRWLRNLENAAINRYYSKIKRVRVGEDSRWRPNTTVACIDQLWQKLCIWE